MNKPKVLNPELVAASGKRSVAKHVQEVLENGGTTEERVAQLNDIADYFATIQRNAPRDEEEAIEMAARREVAGDMHSILRAEETPSAQVESVRCYVAQFIG